MGDSAVDSDDRLEVKGGLGSGARAWREDSSWWEPSPDAGEQTECVAADMRAVLVSAAVGETVGAAELSAAFAAVIELAPPTRDVMLGSLMATLMARGPAVDDVEALLRAALGVDGRRAPEVIRNGDRPVLLLAGSGKKGVRTLNVSTPAALVAAAAGAYVIKVGSAATSSALGSRDLVRALGLRECRVADDVRVDLAASGFAFVALEPEIPVLDRLYGGRFHMPNPFSFGLAPLASPVRGEITVFGLAHPRVDVAAQVLSRFGMDRVDVVSTRLPGAGYLDEIAAVGDIRWCRVRGGVVGTVETESADSYAVSVRYRTLPRPHTAAEAVERTVEVLSGGGLPSHRVLVACNAAHLLMASGLVPSMPQGMAVAEDILRSGAALANVPVGRKAVPHA